MKLKLFTKALLCVGTVGAFYEPSVVFAADEPISATTQTTSAAATVVQPLLASTADSSAKDATPSMSTEQPAATAADALKQKESDATKQKNLEEVFNRDKTYSLSKKGSYSADYQIDYSYYRDTVLDLALDDGSTTLTRLRIEEDAQHTIVNTLGVSYGLLNNVTLGASLPLVAKADFAGSKSTVGLGDLSFSARWEPFPIEAKKMPLTLFGSLSTKTGDSPYDIPASTGLSTGKGYYSVSGGASTRKYFDPVVLFSSVSVGYGLPVSGLDQRRGTRVLTDFSPGFNGGYSLGFAYSLNYDVSLTMSFQQSFAAGGEFRFSNDDISRSAFQSSATMNFAMGIRVSPKTLVNANVGFGLTEDAPDVMLGLSFPLDFTGFGRVVK